MHRRTLLKAAGATLASSTLAAPAIAQSNTKVLRCAPEANLASIDPIWTTATVAINHGYMVYDTLYGTDLSLTPRPQMVAGHTVSDDNRTWTFTLRDGLAFHDGEPGAFSRLHPVDRPLVQAGRVGPGTGFVYR